MDKSELTGLLANVTYGKQIRPIYCLIYGEDGVGKSTFASQAPNPIFLGTESGSAQLNVARLPKPLSASDFLKQAEALLYQEHPFKSVVIDTLDWLEPLIWKKVISEGKSSRPEIKSIEQYEGGFGKGYVRAAEIWRGIIDVFAQLAERHHVILIAHASIKRFDPPEHKTTYDRYQIGINDRAAAIVRQAVDAVLFASFRTQVVAVSKHSGKGIGEAERVVYTEHRPAFDAKNRFSLPFEIPLDWVSFAKAVKAFYDGEPKAETKPAELAPKNETDANETQPLPEPQAA